MYQLTDSSRHTRTRPHTHTPLGYSSVLGLKYLTYLAVTSILQAFPVQTRWGQLSFLSTYIHKPSMQPNTTGVWARVTCRLLYQTRKNTPNHRTRPTSTNKGESMFSHQHSNTCHFSVHSRTAPKQAQTISINIIARNYTPVGASAVNTVHSKAQVASNTAVQGFLSLHTTCD